MLGLCWRKEGSEGAICKWWLGLWIAQSGRLKGEFVMGLVTARATVTVMVKSWVVAGGVIST